MKKILSLVFALLSSTMMAFAVTYIYIMVAVPTLAIFYSRGTGNTCIKIEAHTLVMFYTLSTGNTYTKEKVHTPVMF